MNSTASRAPPGDAAAAAAVAAWSSLANSSSSAAAFLTDMPSPAPWTYTRLLYRRRSSSLTTLRISCVWPPAKGRGALTGVSGRGRTARGQAEAPRTDLSRGRRRPSTSRRELVVPAADGTRGSSRGDTSRGTEGPGRAGAREGAWRGGSRGSRRRRWEGDRSNASPLVDVCPAGRPCRRSPAARPPRARLKTGHNARRGEGRSNCTRRPRSHGLAMGCEGRWRSGTARSEVSVGAPTRGPS